MLILPHVIKPSYEPKSTISGELTASMRASPIVFSTRSPEMVRLTSLLFRPFFASHSSFLAYKRSLFPSILGQIVYCLFWIKSYLFRINYSFFRINYCVAGLASSLFRINYCVASLASSLLAINNSLFWINYWLETKNSWLLGNVNQIVLSRLSTIK